MSIRLFGRGFGIATGISLTLITPAFADPAPTCGSPPTGWETLRPDRSQVVNTIILHQKASHPHPRVFLPTWNGAPVTPEQVREYVRLTVQMKPTPTLLLVVSPFADCEQVALFRQIIDETLNCETDQCIEVAP